MLANSINNLIGLNMKPQKIDAIISLVPGAEITVHADGETIWHNPSEPVVTGEQIEAELQRLQNLWDYNEYQRKRALEYPDFRDYLDGIVKNDQYQIQAYIDACQLIKNKYPKPE
jgi:hypothetical protein